MRSSKKKTKKGGAESYIQAVNLLLEAYATSDVTVGADNDILNFLQATNSTSLQIADVSTDRRRPLNEEHTHFERP